MKHRRILDKLITRMDDESMLDIRIDWFQFSFYNSPFTFTFNEKRTNKAAKEMYGIIMLYLAENKANYIIGNLKAKLSKKAKKELFNKLVTEFKEN